MYVPPPHVLNKAYDLNSLESGAIYCLTILLYLSSSLWGNLVIPSFPLFCLMSDFQKPAAVIFTAAVPQIMVRDEDSN
jgi:hypothetical protein